MCCLCVLKVGDEFLELERGWLVVSIFGNVADAATIVTGLVLFVQFRERVPKAWESVCVCIFGE